MYTEYQNEVIELLVQESARLFGVDPSTLSGETRFKEDLAAKSIDIVRYTAMLEEEYDIEVPFMAFNRCQTFGEAAVYMSEITGF